jgi:hypothetical protein
MRGILLSLLLLGLFILAVAIIAIVLLAGGMLLARFFPVSVFEATIVQIVAVMGCYWLLRFFFVGLLPGPLYVAEEDDEDSGIPGAVTTLPAGGRRQGKRRRR